MLAADVNDVDRLAEALKVDGVVIEQAMGAGQADAAHDRIAQLVKETPFPVYVAMVKHPRGLAGDGSEAAEELAALLHRRIGGTGVYVVGTTEAIPRIVSYGLGADPALLQLSASADSDLVEAALVREFDDYVYPPKVLEVEAWARQAEELVAEAQEHDGTGKYPSTLSEEEVAELVEVGLPMATSQDWRPEVRRFVPVRAASQGWAGLVGGLAGLVVALLVGQSLRGWPRGSGARASDAAPEPVVPDIGTERTAARKELEALTRALARLSWAKADPDVAQAADQARVAASMLLESDDVADVVGARALAAVGRNDVRRAAGRTAAVLHPCWFDPRHPASTETVSWRLGDGAVDVPCCLSCRKQVLRMGGRPDVLVVPGRRGPRPYFERDDVWARTGFGALTDHLADEVLRDREGRR